SGQVAGQAPSSFVDLGPGVHPVGVDEGALVRVATCVVGGDVSDEHQIRNARVSTGPPASIRFTILRTSRGPSAVRQMVWLTRPAQKRCRIRYSNNAKLDSMVTRPSMSSTTSLLETTRRITDGGV